MRTALVTFPIEGGKTKEFESKIISTKDDIFEYGQNFPFHFSILKNKFSSLIDEGKKIIVNRRGGWCLEGGTIKIMRYVDVEAGNTVTIWPG